MGAAIRIIQPGLLTTVQDLGRPGRLGMALSRSGALDRNALMLANALVGNALDAAGLEITGNGPIIAFHQPTAIAWTGAAFDTDLLINGKAVGRLKSHRPILVPANSTVRWKNSIRGFRAWIAFAGGICLPQILQSRSSHLAAQIGLGRLEKNAELPLGELALGTSQSMLQTLGKDSQALHLAGGSQEHLCIVPRWSIPEQLPQEPGTLGLYAFEGRHFALLEIAQQQALWNSFFQVSPKSNRQGLRLEGPTIAIAGLGSLPSEPVRMGTVQLPPEGMPYLLLAEHQTTGGYPRVLEVCSSMAQTLAQAGPGVRVRFIPTTLAQAQERLRNQEQELRALRNAIDAKLRA